MTSRLLAVCRSSVPRGSGGWAGSSWCAPSPPGHSWSCSLPSWSSCPSCPLPLAAPRTSCLPSAPPPRARAAGDCRPGRSSRPWRGRRARTSCSCWSRTPARPGTRRGRHASPRHQDRHSRPRHTRTGPRGCSTAARCSSAPHISGLET